MKDVILLDLNYTLAKSISLNTYNWTYDVSKDVYSSELVEVLLRMTEANIHLITARPDIYREETLENIKVQTGLIPYASYFKPKKLSYVPIHKVKRDYAKKMIQKGIDPESILAIESNVKTRNEYKKCGIVNVYTRDQYIKKFKNEELLLFNG